MKITIEVKYDYFNDQVGEFKRVVLRKKNFLTTKSDAELSDLQEEIQELIESEGYPVELDGESLGKDHQMYSFEIAEQFDEREQGSDLAHRIMDSFCDRAS